MHHNGGIVCSLPRTHGDLPAPPHSITSHVSCRATSILGWLDLCDFQIVDVSGDSAASPTDSGELAHGFGGALATTCAGALGDGAMGALTTEEERAGTAEELAAAAHRSSAYLNGLPCFMLDTYRSSGARLPSAASAIARIKRVVSSAAISGEKLPTGLFDDLLVSGESGAPRLIMLVPANCEGASRGRSSSSLQTARCFHNHQIPPLPPPSHPDYVQVCAMHHIESELFPRFLQSSSFVLYTDMQFFAFSREPLTRSSFKWLRVRLTAVRRGLLCY